MNHILNAGANGFISEKHQRIAEIINDYEPNLSLVWIPYGDRIPEDRDKEFAVLHNAPGREPYIVFYCKEYEVDERLLAKLWAADNNVSNVLNTLEIHNAAIEAVKLKEKMDAEQERAELAESIWKSPKSVYKHNGVKYR